MKKITIRIFVLLFALIYTSYSLLFSFCVPVYAAELPPDLYTQLEEVVQTYEVSFSDLKVDGVTYGDPIVDSLLMVYEVATMFPPSDFVYDDAGNIIDFQPVATTETLAEQQLKDFVSEYSDDFYRVAVYEPSQTLKTLFWDYPNEAVGTLMEKSEADLVVIGDTLQNALAGSAKAYVSFSDRLMSSMQKFITSHTKDGVYYTQVPSTSDFASSTQISNLPNVGRVKFDNSYNYTSLDMSREAYFIIYKYRAKSNFSDDEFYYISLRYKRYNDNTVGGTLENSYELHYDNYFTLDQIMNLETNLPIYRTPGDLDVSDLDWYKKGLNYVEPVEAPAVANRVGTPLTSPTPFSYKLPYASSDIKPYIDAKRELAKQTETQLKDETVTLPVPAQSITLPAPETKPVTEVQPVTDPDENGGNDKPPVTPGTDDPEPGDDDDPDLEIPDDSGGDPIVDLSEFFPFCLPKDLYLAMTMLSIEDEEEYFSVASLDDGETASGAADKNPTVNSPVQFEIPVTFNLSGVNSEDVDYNFVVDIIHPSGGNFGGAEEYVAYLRFFLTFIYIIFLIFATIKLIPR